jgi:hypothetical protein
MRIATVILIVLVGSIVLHAQKLEPPPLLPAQREATPLFPAVPPDQAVPRRPGSQSTLPLWSEAEIRVVPTRPAAPHVIAGDNVPLQRSGPVCLKSVPVDASIDPAFVKPVPTTGLAARIIEMPPCVQLAP